jgi:hypothetical protein
MKYALAVLTSLVWALWIGGLVALFIFVVNLFRHDRPLAISAAPYLFLAFERFQLILAATGLVAIVLWRIHQPRAILTAIFGCFAVATLAGVISSTLITPQIMQMRAANQTDTPRFRKLHGQSMWTYTSETVMLLIAGILLPAAISGIAPRPKLQTVETPEPVTAPPA